MELKTYIVDGQRMTSREQAHAYLQEVLALPAWYGKNLDALYDCLTEMGPEVFFFENAGEGSDYFRKVLRVFKDAVRENPAISIAEKIDE